MSYKCNIIIGSKVIFTLLHNVVKILGKYYLVNNIIQEQVEDMKKKYELMEKDRAEVIAENKRLAEPLQHAREEVEQLRKQLSNYEKDKETLRVRILCVCVGGGEQTAGRASTARQRGGGTIT